MRKMFAAAALCAVAIIPVAAANGAAKKGVHKVSSKVNIVATPTNEAVPPSTKQKTTSITVTGTLKTQDACRGGRTIKFRYATPSGIWPLAQVATTDSKGHFTVTLPPPSGAYKTPNTITVQASSKRLPRRDKATGGKVICLDNQLPGLADFTQL